MSSKLDILSVAKKQKSNNKTQTNSQPQSTLLTSNSISAIDEAFFYGNSDNNNNPYYNEPSRLYDPQEELRSLQEKSYLKNVNNSKLPKAILESIINNPIEVSYDGLLGSTNVVTEDIQARSLDIIAKLDSRDKSKSTNNSNTESQTQTINSINENINNTQSIDLNQLGSLIENIIDNKLNSFLPKLLNESKNHSNNKMSIMKLGENFTFIDDDNNVYECKMIYKGKVKSKKK